MSQMTFGLRIAATDDTQGALRSSLSGFISFARKLASPITIPLRIVQGGSGLLRDINLGLMPLVRRFDDLVTKGAALDAIQRSFTSLTGRSAKDAEHLANRLVAAAGGLLDDSRAMQLANRAIAGGVDAARDLPLIFEFAAKKAVSMGLDTGSMLDQMFSGFMRGSTRQFEPLGILQKGVEGVKRDFEAMKGKGAWDMLAPTAQQAEMMRQAAGEMRAQLGRLGVSGKETIFLWSGIKNQVGDAVDKLFQAVANSKSMRDALGGARDVLAGLTKHFESKGTIWEVIFGKEGGKSKGLFGFLEAGILDLGEMAGRGILGGILKGLSKLPDLGNWLWDKMGGALDMLSEKLAPIFEPIKKAIVELANWFKQKLGPVIEWLEAKLKPLVDWAAKKFAGIGEEFMPKMGGGTAAFNTQWWASNPAGKLKAVGLIATDFLDKVFGGLEMGAAGIEPGVGAPELWAIRRRIEQKQQQRWLEWQKDYGQVPARKPTPREVAGMASPARGALPFPLMGLTRAALYGIVGGAVGQPETMWDWMGREGDAMLGGISGFGRIRQAMDKFRGDFPGKGAEDFAFGELSGASIYALTWFGRQRLRREQARIEHDADVANSGGFFIRQRAILWAGQEARELRRQGYRLTPGDEADLRERAIVRLRDAAIESRRPRIAEIDEALMHDRERRMFGGGAAQGKDTVAEAIKNSLDRFTAAATAAFAELVNVNRRLAVAGPRRG